MDIYCEDCGAEFRQDCQCLEQIESIDIFAQERWVGYDGHAYIGDKSRPSAAFHDDENCRCPRSANFDPESWY